MGGRIFCVVLLCLSTVYCSDIHAALRTEQYVEALRGRLLGKSAVLQAIRDVEPQLTTECSAEILTMLDAATQGNIWPLRILDSWGAPQPGLFTGDNYWEGHWDQCNDMTTQTEIIGVETQLKPRYCTVEWDGIVPVPILRDGIGLCLPSACGPEDFVEVLQFGVNQSAIAVPLGYPESSSLMEAYCPQTFEEKREDLVKDPEAIAAISVLMFFVLLAIMGTLCDVIHQRRERHQKSQVEGKANLGFEHDQSDPEETFKTTECVPRKPNKCEQFLMCFSVARHGSSILNFTQPRGSIACLNGLRFLTFAWIVLGHTATMGVVVSTAASTLGNKLNFISIASSDISSPITHMSICVETFFILSAMLNVISFMKKLEKQKPDCEMMGMYYFHRFWRLTPVYMFILMFYACLYPYLGAGPWYRDKGDALGCKGSGSWWTNFIYLNNLIEVNGQDCMSWTWYMANDFQFYVFAPVLLFPLFYKPVVGLVLTGLCALGGIAANIALHHKMIVNEEPISQNRDIYIKPWTRCVTYFMGMFLGYILHKTKFKVKIHQALAVLGWLAALALITATVFVPQADDVTVWTAAGSAAWNTLRRPIFGLGVCWVIFACVTGYGGFINSILAWNGWLPWAKLSYVGYLIHPISLYWYAHYQPFQIYFSQWLVIFSFIAQLFFCLGISLVVSVLYEAPFTALERVMFADLHKKKKDDSNAVPTVVQVSAKVEANDYAQSKM